ncbi:pantoate--beta-alanine ligase [Sporolactobacillus shoreicorticis]|uniref:Pantothenate synthetase n=1 Tax=Sporolactobacillus shoreicorticis TaxID=1923877 RepID=A0ABW5S6B1_9BACL
MLQLTDPAALREFVKSQKRLGKSVGFVPTMGYLHKGHASLFKKAAETSDVVVASVFVNPTQFGEKKDDYDNYPKDSQGDARLAESCGVNVLFLPKVETIYPNGQQVTVKVNEKTGVLCGKSRPGHFDGVATVLTKLFTIVAPDIVYFGMKDAQQVAIVRSLIDSFHFPIKLIACPIMREADGLAKSSRNVRLLPDERREAPELYKGLQAGCSAIRNGERNFDRIIASVRRYYELHLQSGVVDYVDVLNYPELKRVKDKMTGRIIIAIAVRYANARLIDNVTIDCGNKISEVEAQ